MLALTLLTLVSVVALALTLGLVLRCLVVLDLRADLATARLDALSCRLDRANDRIVRLEDEWGL